MVSKNNERHVMVRIKTIIPRDYSQWSAIQRSRLRDSVVTNVKTSEMRIKCRHQSVIIQRSQSTTMTDQTPTKAVVSPPSSSFIEASTYASSIAPSTVAASSDGSVLRSPSSTAHSSTTSDGSINRDTNINTTEPVLSQCSLPSTTSSSASASASSSSAAPSSSSSSSNDRGLLGQSIAVGLERMQATFNTGVVQFSAHLATIVDHHQLISMSRLSCINTEVNSTAAYVLQALMMVHAFTMSKVRHTRKDDSANPSWIEIISALEAKNTYDVVIRASKN